MGHPAGLVGRPGNERIHRTYPGVRGVTRDYFPAIVDVDAGAVFDVVHLI